MYPSNASLKDAGEFPIGRISPPRAREKTVVVVGADGVAGIRVPHRLARNIEFRTLGTVSLGTQESRPSIAEMRERLAWRERRAEMRERLARWEHSVWIDDRKYLLRASVQSGWRGTEPLAIARDAAWLAAEDLNVPYPQVEESERTDCLGWTSPNIDAIFIQISLCCCDEAITAAHEIRHRWQFINLPQSSERDAFRYEETFARRYLPTRCGRCNNVIEDRLPSRRYSPDQLRNLVGDDY